MVVIEEYVEEEDDESYEILDKDEVERLEAQERLSGTQREADEAEAYEDTSNELRVDGADGDVSDAESFHSVDDVKEGRAETARVGTAEGTSEPDTSRAPELGAEPAEEIEVEDRAEELTEEEKQERIELAESLKAEGNQLFKEQRYEQAREKYTAALDTAPKDYEGRKAYFSNRAACHLHQERFKDCVQDCSKALKIDSKFVRALMRRCKAHEKLSEIDPAYEDAKHALEIEPGNAEAVAVVRRLEGPVMAQREQQKEEVMGKLKDLGNSILGNFGLSLDNFKTVQDPKTGGYSISFQQ